MGIRCKKCEKVGARPEVSYNTSLHITRHGKPALYLHLLQSNPRCSGHQTCHISCYGVYGALSLTPSQVLSIAIASYPTFQHLVTYKIPNLNISTAHSEGTVKSTPGPYRPRPTGVPPTVLPSNMGTASFGQITIPLPSWYFLLPSPQPSRAVHLVPQSLPSPTTLTTG